MARIRTPYADPESARQGSPGSGATGDMFGANVGQSLEQLGTAAQALGVRVAEYREKEDRLAAASLAARMSADWEIEYQNLMRSAPAGARDFTRSVGDAYDKFSERYTATLSNQQHALARPEFERMRATAIVRGARHEAESAVGHNRLLAERGLAATINNVASNPGAFGSAMMQGNALINSLGLPNDVREEMRRNHLNLLTKGAFESRIYAAKTPQDVDAVMADLATPDWQGRATPATYDHLLDAARTFRRTLAAGRDSVARAAVDHLRDRMVATGANRVDIDPAEIASTDQIVRGSTDPGVQWNWAQLRARYETGRNALRASPDAVAAAANSALAQIGLPADVQAGIDSASRSTGGQVTPSYLAQLANTQSGAYFEERRRGRPEFAMQPVHSRVDIGGLRQDVREAGQLAGEYFGAALRVTSAHRNPFYNERVGGAEGSRHIPGAALDIDTTGMDAATRGRLVDSLVRAGFTGFGQYGTHIHADMRANVAGAYGSRPGWGGWTQLDPEIAAVLDRRGFRAGRAAAEIDRGGAARSTVAPPENGPFNFSQQTWLDLVSRHGTAVGLPTGDMTTQADILKWRQDPQIAARMAALYANENRAELQAGLGRDVSDAELGIAHVMGPANALVLIRAHRDAPQTPVRDVLPQQYPQAGALTVGDAYSKLMEGYVGGVSALQHVRLEEVRRVEGEMNAARNGGDIMAFGARAGRVTLAPLETSDAFTNRGRQALEMQQFYRLEEPRPLTASEVDQFTNVIQTGDVNTQLQLLANLQRLGPRAAAGAFRQLGSQNGMFAHVAGLMQSDAAAGAVAHDVLRGSIRMRDNPDSKQILTTEAGAVGGTDNQFNIIVGQALDGADPRVRQSIRHAADALYVQRFSSGQVTFDPRAYEQAVRAVLNTEVGRVNGAHTILPKGVSASDFDWSLDALTPQDLAGMSVDGRGPLQRDGRTVSPIDIAYEGRFQAVGDNTYRIVMADGLPLWSAQGRDYRIVIKPEDVQRLSSQARSANATDMTVGLAP